MHIAATSLPVESISVNLETFFSLKIFFIFLNGDYPKWNIFTSSFWVQILLFIGKWQTSFRTIFAPLYVCLSEQQTFSKETAIEKLGKICSIWLLLQGLLTLGTNYIFNRPALHKNYYLYQRTAPTTSLHVTSLSPK